MTFLPPSSEQMTFTAIRARTWLLGLYELICVDIGIPIASVLQALIGCWICEEALIADEKLSGAQSLAYEVHRRLNYGEQEIFSTLQNSDAALVLLSAGILRKFNIKNMWIESFIQQVSAMLQIHKDQDQKESSELFAARFLLHTLQLHPTPDTFEINLPPNALGTNLFQANELAIRMLATDVAAATAYGQSLPLAETGLLSQLAVVLPVWMLSYLRQHNLEIGTLLLRTMNYLHLCEDIAYKIGHNFVLAQQQLDGRFGFFAPEISQLRSIKPRFDEIFDLYLPITVSCLWAIAEATNPDFTLFGSI